MKEAFENKLVETLRNYSEKPSDRCWNTISNNLPPVSPAQPAAASSNAVKQFVGSTVGKITTAVVSVATLGTVATLFVINSNNDEKIIENSEKQTIESPAEKEELVVDDVATLPEFENKETSVKEQNISEKRENKIEEPAVFKKEELKEVAVKPVNTAMSESSDKGFSDKIKPKNEAKSSFVPDEEKESYVEEDFVEESLGQDDVFVEDEFIEKPHYPDVEQIVRPNVFTPNGDGVNDFLVFENIEKFPKARLVVVDAKGEKVYERNQYDNSWDGSNTPDGTYFYVLEIFNGEEQFSIYGTIHILR